MTTWYSLEALTLRLHPRAHAQLESERQFHFIWPLLGFLCLALTACGSTPSPACPLGYEPCGDSLCCPAEQPAHDAGAALEAASEATPLPPPDATIVPLDEPCSFVQLEDGHGMCADQGLPPVEYACTGVTNWGNAWPGWPPGDCYWSGTSIACCAVCDPAHGCCTRHDLFMCDAGGGG